MESNRKKGTRFNPNHLRFEDDDLEREYTNSIALKRIMLHRVSIVLAILMYSSFILIDVLIPVGHLDIQFLIRLILVPASLALVLFWTWKESYTAIGERLILIPLATGTFGHIPMAYYNSGYYTPGFFAYALGLMILYNFLFGGIRFRYSLITGLVIILSFGVTEVVAGNQTQVIVTNSFFICSTYVLGALSSYVLERFARVDFLHKLERDQAISQIKGVNEVMSHLSDYKDPEDLIDAFMTQVRNLANTPFAVVVEGRRVEDILHMKASGLLAVETRQIILAQKHIVFSEDLLESDRCLASDREKLAIFLGSSNWTILGTKIFDPDDTQNGRDIFQKPYFMKIFIKSRPDDVPNYFENLMYYLQGLLKSFTNRAIDDLLAKHDDLCLSLYNKRYLEEIKQRIARNLDQFERQYSIIYIDLRDFKEINTMFGHNGADHILTELVQKIIMTSKRSADIPFRVGGDEFMLFLPATTKDEAMFIAKAIADATKRTSIEMTDLSGSSVNARVCFDLGIAESSEKKCLEEVIKLADQRSAEAKRAAKERLRQSKDISSFRLVD